MADARHPLKYSERPYRPCVGIMLINQEGHIFGGQRIDNRAEAWQMPQGGIDEGEDVETCLLS
jgi:putative (di)nucleoside polyphosphate hydrolase